MTDGSSGRQRLARTLGRRGLFTALVTAGALYVFLLVQGTIVTLASVLGGDPVRAPAARDLFPSRIYVVAGPGPDLAAIWSDGVQRSLLTDLPFAIGFFLALWQLLPIAPELRFGHVVTRALFGGGLGAVAVFVVGVAQTVVVGVVVIRAVGFDAAFSGVGPAIGTGVVGSLLHAITTWAIDVPLVVLAGLLLWGWLQRFPPKHGVAGVVDEL